MQKTGSPILLFLHSQTTLPYDFVKKEVPYSREQKHVSISDTPMLLIKINSISNMVCQK